MPTLTDIMITQQTLNWIRSFIIGYNICPFAKHVVNQGSLKTQVCFVNQLSNALVTIDDALNDLDNNAEIETTLLIFPSFAACFLDYLDFVDLAESLLIKQGFEGVYQLASFHPDYCFANAPIDDAANYTNRSPYPMVHILRESSIDKAIEFYGDTEGIPERNIAILRQLGIDVLKNI